MKNLNSFEKFKPKVKFEPQHLYLTKVSTLQGMSTIQRCLSNKQILQGYDICQRDVCASSPQVVYYIELCTWQECPPSKGFLIYRYTVFAPGRGVNLTEVSTTQICGSGRGVNLAGMLIIQIDLWTWQECPSCRVLNLTEVSILHGCLSNRFVHLTEMSTFQIDLYIWQECPLLKDGWNTVVHLTGCEPFKGVISVMCTWLQGWVSSRGTCHTELCPFRGENVEGMSTLQGCLTNLMPEST